MADRGENISRFFTGKGKMMPPIQRVNVDFTAPMLNELDDEARALNISRQAVIKSLLRQALDRQRLARRAR
jgi:metal-responsive CopG/Arc/MetJ family transcriptional regulator